jgi:hypothetical protein
LSLSSSFLEQASLPKSKRGTSAATGRRDKDNYREAVDFEKKYTGYAGRRDFFENEVK